MGRIPEFKSGINHLLEDVLVEAELDECFVGKFMLTELVNVEDIDSSRFC